MHDMIDRFLTWAKFEILATLVAELSFKEDNR